MSYAIALPLTPAELHSYSPSCPFLIKTQMHKNGCLSNSPRSESRKLGNVRCLSCFKFAAAIRDKITYL
ncbi:hypothetical protein MC7420_2400 [Coleofasciculus chthonoplastes PCC 7420]|uniref:Uncharacterized protein n=1 Tax=Coleofasciculus chthonoplastes PCC 7420 TaxID=118168 RepID=B4W226_9CYAN|nr:hypothetical protein MC7420_2400 [Coleofasciculus chthonoplastes PCC 7420]